jgi:hypothetical protein
MSPTSIQKLVYTLLGGGYSIIYVFETNTALQVYYVCSSLNDEKWSPQRTTKYFH